jgi:predicted Zn finger-like uncharacterized protein
VVVVCEKCHTRFHLSDSKVSAKGTRVRCSRCKHAFFITLPGAEKAEAIDEVVAEVTGPGEAPPPEATRDLLAPNLEAGEPEPRDRPAQLWPEEPDRGECEQDWEFNDDSVSEIRGKPQPEPIAIDEPAATALDPAGELPDPEITVGVGDSIGEPEIATDGADFLGEAEIATDGADFLGEAEIATDGADFLGEAEIATDGAGFLGEPEIATDGADFLGEPEIAADSADLIDEPEMPPVQEPEGLDPVAAIRAREAGLDASSAEDIGSPEEWDFLGTAEVEPPEETAPEAGVSEPAVPVEDEASSASSSPLLSDSPTAAPAARVDSGRHVLTTRLAGLASIASWVLVALAFSVGISAVFAQPGEKAAMSAGPVEIPVSGLTLTATEVRSRWVENALAGNLLVVSGMLENPGSRALTPRRAVWVQLVSAEGEPIAGARAAAGRALDERSLREWDPNRLRRVLADSAAARARRPFRPGERVRFDAVFELVPESATGWVFQSASLPSRPSPGILPPSTALPAWE